MYPYFHLFGLDLPAYGMSSFVGCLMVALYVFLTNRGGKLGRLPGGDLVNLGVMATVGALVGGILLYALTLLPLVVQNWAILGQNPWHLRPLLFGGLVFSGGLAGGFAAVFWYCRHYRLPLKTVVAIFTPAIPLFHVFGRVGCFLAGCCWGIEVPFGLVYRQALAAPNGVPLLPLQLIEAAANLLLFIVLAVSVRKLRQKWRVLPLYLALYGALRFVLEFFRGDAIRGVWLLSTSQWISLALLLAALGMCLAEKRRKTPAPQA